MHLQHGEKAVVFLKIAKQHRSVLLLFSQLEDS
jgi:hypothetical protein